MTMVDCCFVRSSGAFWDPVSPWVAVFALLLAFSTSFLIAKKFGSPPEKGRFSSIDGLRGYLAFFVFLHHSCVWYFYLRTNEWKVPPSNLYTHFGQSSVALFFMITGFLFFSKLIEERERKTDWGRLFLSRIFRLVPLYFFAMFLFFLVVIFHSKGVLNVPILKLTDGVIRWLGFTLTGGPDLNAIDRTWIIVAGVTWSLSYEWVFYLSLPLLAMTIGVVPPLIFIGIGVVSLVYLEAWHTSIHYLSFVGGIIAALLVRLDWLRRFAIGKMASFIAMGCIVLAVAIFPSAYGIGPLFLLAISFSLIASGNSLFGLLVSESSRTLGEFAYGIYLLHGITLFCVFNFLIGLPESKALSPLQFWCVVLGITPVLIFFCFLTFRFIEHPAMLKVMPATNFFRTWGRRRAG